MYDQELAAEEGVGDAEGGTCLSRLKESVTWLSGKYLAGNVWERVPIGGR